MSLAPLWDDDAEQAVLGAVMLDGALLDEIATMLTPDDFAREAWQLVFRAMLSLSNAREPIDTRTLTDQLRKDGVLMRVGVANVAALDTMTPASTSWKAYAGIVRDFALRRRTVAVCMSAIESIRDTGQSVVNVVGSAETQLAELMSGRITEEFVPFRQVLQEEFLILERDFEGKDKPPGIMTGIRKLDDMTTGFKPGDLVIVAGTAGAGKTAFAINTAVATAVRAETGHVIVFEQEMNRTSLFRRIMSGEGNIDNQRLFTGHLIPSDFGRVTNAIHRIMNGKIDLKCAHGVTVFDVRARCRRAVQKFGKVSLVVVDYLQIMRSLNPDPRANEEQKVREFAQGMKSIAREFNCVVMALSQLNRDNEKAADKRPTLGGLRGSGAIAAEADTVLLFHRPAATEVGGPPETEGEINIAKQRSGPTGPVKVLFHGPFTTFKDHPDQR